MTVTRFIRVTTALAMATATACGSDKPDAAHQALQIRRDFEAHFRDALLVGNGDIVTSKSTGNYIQIHAPEDGCAKIGAALAGTKAPAGLTLSCYSLVKGDQWRLWSNEISVLEVR